MNEENNRNTITYDEDWQTVSSSVYPKRYTDEDDVQVEEKAKKPKKDGQKQLLITIQLVVCIIIALAAFVLKFIGGDIYQNARNWYYTELNKSVIASSDGADYSLDKALKISSADEAENS